MTREDSNSPRYEQVPTAPEDANFDAELPPNYNEIADETAQASSSILPPYQAVGDGKESTDLPSYSAATSLPTYKDVEKLKKDEASIAIINELFNLRDDEPESNEPRLDGVAIGNDCMFFFAYMVAFFFNWIGLFVGYFIMYNWAGRYGAMAGFGTSMIKWLVYLRYSQCCHNYYLNEHVYMFWILIFFAFVIFMKGMVNWVTVRRFRYVTASTVDTNARYTLFE